MKNGLVRRQIETARSTKVKNEQRFENNQKIILKSRRSTTLRSFVMLPRNPIPYISLIFRQKSTGNNGDKLTALSGADFYCHFLKLLVRQGVNSLSIRPQYAIILFARFEQVHKTKTD